MALLWGGEGGLVSLGGHLSIIPSKVRSGTVVVGSHYDVPITIRNDSDASIDVYELNPPAPWTIEPPVPDTTLAPGQYVVVTFRFTPTSAQVYSDTVDIYFTGVDSPIVLELEGTGVATGGGISIEPSEWDFGPQKVATTSSEKIFTITNNGDANVSVTAIAYPESPLFTKGTADPDPGPLPQTLAPGETLTFSADFTPSVEGYFSKDQGVKVTVDGTDYYVKLMGTGYVIEPVHEVTGVAKDILAFFGAGGKSYIMEMNSNDWDTEENCVLDKRTVVGIPYLEKTVMRVAFKYEDYGPATISVLAHVKRRKEDYVERRDVKIGTNLCDNWIRTAFVDFELTGELIEISFVREKGNGPVCITEYAVFFNPAGELKEDDV